jgi:vanillate O-demethylase monooxygenase subunit
VWLKNRWHVAAFSDQLGDGLVSRQILGIPIVLYRTSEGAPVALADACAHRGLPLSLGKRLGDQVQCGYHGMRYGPDGVCRGVPGQDSVPSRARVTSYPVIERHGLVWIWTADPSLITQSIPDVPWLSDPAWAVVRGYHHIEAAGLLVVDNLLDLSHETFVHAETIGNSAVADSPVTAEIVDGARVRVHRYMSNIEPPPLYAAQRGECATIDRWHTTTYVPPGYIVIESGSKPTGATDNDVQERRIINFVTPETETSCHYHWCVARNYRIDDSEASAVLRSQVVFTFDQDKALLEAQQRSLGNNVDAAFAVSIKVDAGPTQGRRLLQRLVIEEQRPEKFEPAQT